ncbi:MAG: flagellar motor switch protein FliG [Nitrospirae bacterium]|nr:MAG: flagellar motor switch protein FliG [Nitrospirota bacterium]
MAELSGAEKAAVFLSYVGEDVASEILKSLDEDLIREIVSAMSDVRTLKKEEVKPVIEEVKKKVKEESVVIGGKDFVQKLLSKGLGDDNAKKLLENTKRQGPIDKLNRTDPELLASFLVTEHPQSIAIILALLDPKKSAKVLALLPDELKADVAIRISNLKMIPDDAVKEIENVLQTQFNITDTGGRKIEGPKAAAEILNNIPKELEQTIMEVVEEKEPEKAEQIKALMFVFDDLVNVDDRGIQSLLKEVSTSDLALALKGASERLREKIFNNMSKRAAEMLKDEMDTMGPVRVSDVEQAQKNIVEVARRLEGEGKIILAGKGSEELIV